MKKELLIPVGNFECLKYAIFNGCDAVYLAGQKFGARAYAENFTLEELKRAVLFCHLYDVKVYVALNIMIFERELEMVISYVNYLISINVDALIVSDIGIISYLQKHYPNLEIHASTQAHTFNLNQILFLKSLGVKRVVVDRELSLEEIHKFDNIIDIEVFIHGALCVSYSGNCLMSYMINKRSGNRGSCAQVCRMPYKLEHQNKLVSLKEKYLLSTKELNTSYHIEELLKSNVVSFKVEGRMKSPSYVGFITRYYRTLIDNYEKKGVSVVDEQELEKLKVIFNREFTDGYLFNSKNIYNMKTPNHQGVLIGYVMSYTQKLIKIKLIKPLNQEDGIRFTNEDKGMIVNYLYNQNKKLINGAKSKDTIYVLNKIGLKSLGEVRKTIDHQLELELQKFPVKKIPIDINLDISFHSFKLIVTDGKNKIVKENDSPEKAKNISTTKEEIIKQINKIGNTPFIINNLKINLEPNLFIPLSKINEIRRNALQELEKERQK